VFFDACICGSLGLWRLCRLGKWEEEGAHGDDGGGGGCGKELCLGFRRFGFDMFFRICHVLFCETLYIKVKLLWVVIY
jgi:hypothetical protein